VRHLLPLYAKLINKVGTQKYAFDEFDNLKSLYTLNGFTSSLNTASHSVTLDEHDEFLLISIGFLERNTGHAMDLLMNWFTSATFGEHKHITTQLQ
jgi:Zn-dependent M16 (insulinase) family peptidase